MAVYFMIGLLLVFLEKMTMSMWLWGWALFAIVMVIAFVVSSLSMVGAGDAKFAAAMAPFFVGAPAGLLFGLFCASLLAAFFSHRIMRAIPPVRAATADWASWTNRQFPMGLGLAGALAVYLDRGCGLWLTRFTLC